MMVAGDIKTEKGLGVKNADVILRSNQAGMEKQRLTDGNGDYVFGDLPVMVDYHVTGKKRDDWMNGVSTLDLVMMQRHILGLAPFHNGYKMVAADVNNDSKVSASDMVVLRKLILGLITELPNNDSWRFLDAQTPIANPDNPWPLDEEIVIESVDHDMMDQHLMGVKVGDVTQDASASGIIAETRSDKVAQLVTENINVSQGDLVTIPFRISDLTSLAGVQFTMKFKNLEFVTIQSGKLEITELNYGIHSNDMLTFSWSSHDAIACFDSDILFSVVVKARSGGRMGEMITLGSWITSAEGYDAGNATYRINLKHVSTDTEGAFALLQNEPNPFKSSTRIGIVLPAQEQIKLQICDVTGRVVYRKELDGKRGINHLEVTKNELQGTGIYYYTVIAGEKSATKSFVILD